MGWATYPLLRLSTGDLGEVIGCRIVVGDEKNLGTVSSPAKIRVVREKLALSETTTLRFGV